MDKHKQQLHQLLTGLEIKHIDDLIENGTPELFRKLGTAMTEINKALIKNNTERENGK